MSFWRPGTVAPGSSIDRDADPSGAGAGAVGAVTGRVSNVAVSERRNRLPIAKQRKCSPTATLTSRAHASSLLRRCSAVPPRAAPRRRATVAYRYRKEYSTPSVLARSRMGIRGSLHRRHSAAKVSLALFWSTHARVEANHPVRQGCRHFSGSACSRRGGECSRRRGKLCSSLSALACDLIAITPGRLQHPLRVALYPRHQATVPHGRHALPRDSRRPFALSVSRLAGPRRQ